MKVIYKPPHTGKTAEIIKLCAQNPGSYIVCTTSIRCLQVFLDAQKLGYTIPEPITIHSFIQHRYSPGVKAFLFDDIDRSLEFISYAPVLAVSVTNRDVEFMGGEKDE